MRAVNEKRRDMDGRIDYFASRRHQWLNFFHTWLLVGGSLALFALSAWIFFGPGGIVWAAVFGGVSLFAATRISPAMVLRMYRAREVRREDFPAGHALIDALAARAGLEVRPKLYILPSNMMNAFAVGRQRDSAICLTDRLVRQMSRRELAGILAHEISHIRNEDIRVMAIADMVSRFTSVLSTLGVVSLFLNVPAILMGLPVQVPWFGILILVLAPTIGGLLQLALSRTREYDADFSAAMLTGDPDGLASALSKLEAFQGRHWEGMVLPGGRVPDPSLLRTHPRTADRIARLMELKAQREDLPDLSPPVATPVRVAASPVPRIRRADRQSALHRGVWRNAAPMPLEEFAADGDAPASNASLHPPRGGPRLRMRGGVWW